MEIFFHLIFINNLICQSDGTVVRISSPTGAGVSIQPVELLVTLELGKGFRQNVTVEPATIPEVAVPMQAIPPPAANKEEFSNAMKEVAAPPSSNGVAAASQNGHAVV